MTRWINVTVRLHLDLHARLGDIFQHAEFILVLAVQHQLLQGEESFHDGWLWQTDKHTQIKKENE